jgi:mpaB/rubber oxygenase-like protein
MTEEQLRPLKYSYDTLADATLERLQQIKASQQNGNFTSNGTAADPKPSPAKRSEPNGHHVHSDLFTLLHTHHSTDPILSKFWAEVTTVPPWVSWAQLARGQDVFYRYGGANLTGLAFLSLLGGLGAWRVVEVLSRTGGFATNVARRRLYETTQHILQVTRTLEGIKPGGEGWMASVRVRLLHAQVRQRILKLAETDPGYYNVEEWGVPANDFDSIATIATFSSTLLWQALPRQGLFLSTQEKEDYLALWRYVGYLLGTPTEGFFDSVGAAQRTLENLILHEIQPSETSRVLAHNMLQALSRVPPLYSSEEMIAAMARWMNGTDLCDTLGIPRPGLYYYALMVGQCLFFMWSCYLARVWPWWDRRKQRLMRRAFWVMIVESKTGLGGKEARFEFKWVPRLGKVTGRQLREEKSVAIGGIERRNLKTTAFAGTMLLLILWMTWWMLKRWLQLA